MSHILSLSYGKDSLACIHVIKDVLGWPLDRIVHAEVWATDTIPAELPPRVEFKAKADAIIKDRWGIEVERFCATTKEGGQITYENSFYHAIRPETIAKRKEKGKQISKYQQYDDERTIWGFPIVMGPWCNSKLKMAAIDKAKKSAEGGVSYIGIAADEPERIARHIGKPGVKLPLVEAGWTEAMCREWCEENGLLSPIYTTTARGGCWFCHNQGVDQLRLLRRDYPEYWALLLKWDLDSPTTFKPDGHTVHDYEERFRLEDEGLIRADDRWYWGYLDSRPIQMKMSF